MKIGNLKKITNWEFWPTYMFYVPLLPYAFYLAIKARSFGFFSAVNPGMEGSGNGLESKYKTIQMLPSDYSPITIYVEKDENIQDILPKIIKNNINFPLIIKPDIGFRGLLVSKIKNEAELSFYLKKYNSINLIIQEFVDYKNECGIFYHRIPGEKTGKITSVTLKKYLTAIGDGYSTLLELILNNERAKHYSEYISEINKDRLQMIPILNEKVVLNIIGNHSKGTQFINGNHLINSELENFLDNLNAEIEGWNYGRIDVKYNNFEELLKGENLKIIEINGIISEPTHIYDPSKGSYFTALKSIKNHWKLIYLIGVKNKNLNKGNYTDLSNLIAVYFSYKKYLKKIHKLNSNAINSF
ncbi:MAG: D-alanine--D-alanine ligase [Lutibacter sp.]|nr:D-alanine--D-alanine ligase [Lutibacter sp.]MDT8418219.1 D-alanine--D-alanine ligase [Lutibacter sp.]